MFDYFWDLSQCHVLLQIRTTTKHLAKDYTGMSTAPWSILCFPLAAYHSNPWFDTISRHDLLEDVKMSTNQYEIQRRITHPQILSEVKQYHDGHRPLLFIISYPLGLVKGLFPLLFNFLLQTLSRYPQLIFTADRLFT